MDSPLHAVDFYCDWLLALAGVYSDELMQGGLASLRFYGLMTTAPLLSHSAFPHRYRIALAMLLGSAAAGVGANSNPAASLIELPWLGLGELLVGAALGLGVKLILSALEITVVLLEQHLGFAAGAESDDDAHHSPLGRMFAVLGVFTLLTLTPVGGDLLLLRSLLDSLQTLPPGSAMNAAGPAAFVHDVMHTSLLLGVQLAAPIAASVGLVQAVAAMLARDRRLPVAASLSPLRTILGLVLLGAALTGASERIGDALVGVLSSGAEQVGRAGEFVEP